MSEKSEEAPAGEGGGKKSGKRKIIILVLLLVLLGGGGAGAFLFLGKSKGAEDKEEHKEEHKPHLVMSPLDPPFIVNLGDSGSYLKATIWLEYDVELSKKLAEEAHAGGGHGSGGSGGGDKGPPPLEGIVKTKEPLIKDVIIRILSSKTVDEARSTNLREALKGELVEGINEVITEDEGPVSNVIFTEYIVQ